jgi:phosphate transport system substrate-binding protein
MKIKSNRLFALLAVLALVVAACGGSDDTTDTTEGGGDTATTAASSDTTMADDTATTEGAMMDECSFGLPCIDPLDVTSGEIAMAGSSTVFPLSQAMLALWEDEGGPQYTLDSIGSGGGFERFCSEGASDISNASRAIKDEEKANCVDTWGSEPIEIRVGSDALSLVVSPGNTFATELTLEQIGTAFALPAGSTWADVDPSFPANELVTYSPGTDSGTFDYFNEVVYPDEYEADEPSPILSGGANLIGEDDNLTVDGVAEDGCDPNDTSTTCGIGFFGYAYYQQNADRLTVVSVDAGDGPIEPNDDSVNQGTYPIARPLFMYTVAEVIDSKPQVAEFIAYYLEHVDDIIGDVGYFPAPEDALQGAADNIKTAAGW